ncbi:MAG: response regulator [Gemmatimonadota bacterium]
MATILIVDDLSANRKYLVGLLEGLGHRLLQAADGSAGLAQVRAERPDLIITDVLMPVMDGYEFVRQLRLDPQSSRIPVLFYSAPYSEREARALALSTGASYVLRKPAPPAEVLQVVGRVLADGIEPHPAFDATEWSASPDRFNLRLLTDRLSEQSGDLRMANARLRAVINIGLEMTARQDSDRLLRTVCSAACDLFGASYASIGILEEDLSTVKRRAAWPSEMGDWLRVGDRVSGLLQTVVTERRTVRGENPGGNADSLQLAHGHPEVLSYLAAPIASPSRTYGWFCLVGNEGRVFVEEDEDLVTALAGQVGRIYENGLLTSERGERADELSREIDEHKEVQDSLSRSERLNRNLVEHLPHRILVKDSNSVILFCNANYANDVGLPPEEVVGKDAFAFYAPSLAEAYHADDRKVMADGVMEDVEERYEIAGEERWVHTVKVPYRDERNKIIGILVVFEDITERKQLDEQFRQSQKLEAVGQLAGGVAHDFNNLLTVILGYCDVITGDLKPDDPQISDIEQIRKCGVRAAELTRQLLAFSRKQILEPRVLDLNAVVAGLNAMLQRLIGADIELRTALAPQLGRVRADPSQLEQILMNLVVNASDAIGHGGRIELATADVPSGEVLAGRHVVVLPGGYVMLAVTDNGKGMDSATVARVFEPFFTTKGPGKGTGLGLSTVYGIVKQSNGYVWCTSEPGRGTTFRVYLPQVEEEADAPLVQPIAPAIGGAETILIAEDEAEVRQLVRQILTLAGYTVIVAANGDEALKECSDSGRRIDLLLTDVIMPGMSRGEMIRSVRNIRPEMKVLFMSGYAGEVVLDRGLLGDDRAFLQKPFTREALIRKVREMLDR